MKSATFTLRLSPSLLSEAVKLAEREGVSLNEWIVAAITEKIEAANMAKLSAEARR